MAISIHAPLRGRHLKEKDKIEAAIFQSTPPCGGDYTEHGLSAMGPDFNPRPLAGATYAVVGQFFVNLISIHAPLRGRQPFERDLIGQMYFNPRPLAGATHPGFSGAPGRNHFNPRPLAGATSFHVAVALSVKISIHAPLRGRRPAGIFIMTPFEFQSTPPCGGDSTNRLYTSRRKYFNPRPLAGATNIFHALIRGFRFQSTPPCGGDSICCWFKYTPADFNPRPLAGATPKESSAVRNR